MELREVRQQEIFVSLYSSEGSNIQSWKHVAAEFPRHMISRPIYANEEDISNSAAQVKGK